MIRPACPKKTPPMRMRSPPSPPSSTAVLRVLRIISNLGDAARASGGAPGAAPSGFGGYREGREADIKARRRASDGCKSRWSRSPCPSRTAGTGGSASRSRPRRWAGRGGGPSRGRLAPAPCRRPARVRARRSWSADVGLAVRAEAWCGRGRLQREQPDVLAVEAGHQVHRAGIHEPAMAGAGVGERVRERRRVDGRGAAVQQLDVAEVGDHVEVRLPADVDLDVGMRGERLRRLRAEHRTAAEAQIVERLAQRCERDVVDEVAPFLGLEEHRRQYREKYRRRPGSGRRDRDRRRPRRPGGRRSHRRPDRT